MGKYDALFDTAPTAPEAKPAGKYAALFEAPAAAPPAPEPSLLERMSSAARKAGHWLTDTGGEPIAPSGQEGWGKIRADQAAAGIDPNSREANDPLANDWGAQGIVGGIAGGAAGKLIGPLASKLGPLARVAEKATEGAVANKVQGGDAGMGALVGGALAVPGAARAALRSPTIVNKARQLATKDIGRDIISAEGPRAKVTDQKRIAEVNDRLFNLTQENPDLRSTWRKPAEKALPEIQAAKRAAAEPLDGLYDKADQLTADTSGIPRPEATELSGATRRLSNPNWPTRPDSPEFGPTAAHNGQGGVRLGDIIDGFEADAVAAGKKASGQAEAARFRAVKDNFIKAYGEPGFDPNKPINADGLTAGRALDMLEKAKARGGNVDSQIAQVRKMATGGIDLDKRIPTKMFREEVTDLHKNAESAMGGLEGTARHEALARLYDTGKRIIDEHLDTSGLAPEELAQLRKANDQYFLLSRAEAAIESRGWKEANRQPGLAHSVNQAVHGGSLAAAAGYGVMHPEALPAMAAAYGAAKVAPAVASRFNWALANQVPGAAAGAAVPPTATSMFARAAEEKRRRDAAMAASLSGGMQQ